MRVDVVSGQREPSANARQVARGVRDNFDALVLEGFTPEQALTFIALWFAHTPPAPEDPDG